jgi:hypothetical protein
VVKSGAYEIPTKEVKWEKELFHETDGEDVRLENNRMRNLSLVYRKYERAC